MATKKATTTEKTTTVAKEVKKAEPKKAPVKKAAPKRPAKKTELFIQFAGYEVAEEDLVARAKKEWVDAGNKVGDLTTLSLYVKPEEYKAYFVINGTFAGELDI